MLDFLYSSTKIFVVDQSTFTILGTTESIRVANAICRGIMNTSTMVVSVNKDYDKSKHYVLKQMPIAGGKNGAANTAMPSNDLKQYGIRYDIENVEEITVDIKRNKEIFEIRKIGLESLEQSCMRYLSRLVNFYEDTIFLSTISKELEKSNPQEETYSDGILDWANIMNVSPKAAYQQLKLELDSASISILKMHALWTKYVDKINLLTDQEKISQILNRDFEVEIFVGDDIF